MIIFNVTSLIIFMVFCILKQGTSNLSYYSEYKSTSRGPLNTLGETLSCGKLVNMSVAKLLRKGLALGESRHVDSRYLNQDLFEFKEDKE